MKRTAIIVSAITLVLSTNMLGQQCSQLSTSSSDALVSYLTVTTSSLANAPCLAFAITQLGNQRYQPAIPVLTKFLDFRWPVGGHQKQRLFVLQHDGSSIYPAANALGQIGTIALPAVLNAMKSNTTSRESMEVAVSVWMTIYKSQAPVGVALLKPQADLATQRLTKQRLAWAAFIAAENWCSAVDERQCKTAAGIP